MKFRTFTETVAGILRLPIQHVRTVGVALQSERLIRVGGRGSAGAILDHHDAAALVLGLVVSDKLTLAPRSVRRYNLPCTASAAVFPGTLPSLGVLKHVPSEWLSTRKLTAGHTSLQLLQTLIEDAQCRRLGRFGARLGFLEIRVFAPTAIIEFGPSRAAEQIRALGRLPRAMYCRPQILYDDVELLKRDAVATSVAGASALSIERSLTLDLIAQVGEALAT
jgi:hypothetical protein